jgi:IclR family transcriptional regulator, acetate operon repressor
MTGQPEMDQRGDSGAVSAATMVRESDRDASRSQGTVLVLRKAIAILRAFSHEQPELSLQDLRNMTGLPMTTCQRIVTNLVAERVLERSGDRYSIGRSILEWAAIAKQGTPLNRLLSGILYDLRDATQETACAFTPQGRFRVCIAVVPTTLPVRPQTYVGQAVPLHIGAAGKVLLAFDDDLLHAAQRDELERLTDKTIIDHHQLELEVTRIRKSGYSISSEEGTSGLAGVSAPIFEADGAVVASLALSVPVQRGGRQRLRSLVPVVIEAAKTASDRLGYHAADD